MKRHAWMEKPGVTFGMLVAMCLFLTATAQAGTTYAWTNTTVGYWNSSANWNPATGTPGAASGDTANINTTFAGAYTSVLNNTLANSLTTLTIANTPGQAALIVTNTPLSVATLNLGSGGWLELDNGGILTNTSAFNWTGTNGVIVLNAGGTLFTPAAELDIANNASGITGLVTSTSSQGGTWNLRAQGLIIGKAAATGNVLTIANGAVVTNGSFAIGKDATSVANALAITNGGKVYAGGLTAQGNGNSVLVGGGSQTSVLNLGGGVVFLPQAISTNCSNNSFTIDANGVVTNVADASYGFSLAFLQGYDAVSNSLTVKNGGQLWVNSSVGLTVGFSHATPGLARQNAILISGGMVNVTGPVTLGGPNGSGNTLTITNAGQLFSGGDNQTPSSSYIGAGAGASGGSNNSVTVVGTGSVWNLGGKTLQIGKAAASGNMLTVAAGGLVTNGTIVLSSVNAGYSTGNALVITNGGKVYAPGSFQPVGNGSTVWVGGGSQTSVLDLGGGQVLMPQAVNAALSNNSFTIDANGVVTNVNGAGFNFGWTQGFSSSSNSLTVRNGGQLWTSTLILGRYYNGSFGASSNTALITAGGYVNVTNGVTVGQQQGVQNTMLVTGGGILEANTLTVGNYTGNSLTNSGGVFQFTSSSPTLTPGSFGRIGITNGTVSFRGITTADVLCNQSGGSKPLDSATKMAWSGNNTFSLNNATNNSSGQAYTFSTAYGATNFACLELMNGSAYRGGLVTIGSGGTLLVANGANTIATNLVMQSGSTLAVNLGANTNSSLTVQGTASFNGAALQVGLSATPPFGYAYPIVTATSVAASFGSRTVTATYGGTNYTLVVGNSGGVVTLARATGGTAVMFR